MNAWKHTMDDKTHKQRSAACFFITYKDSFLLTLRNVSPKKGYWSLPGGKVELHENPWSAAVRETLEEIGVDIKGKHKLMGKLFDKKEGVLVYIYIYNCSSKNDWTFHLNLEEVSEISWVTLEQLSKYQLAFSSTKKAIEYWASNILSKDNCI